MELWIRCQNRVNLLEVNHISYDERPANPFENDYTPIHRIYGNKVLLGIYATAERCLEIIDEIQYLLKNNGSTEDRMSQLISGIETKFVVYEMPEK